MDVYREFATDEKLEIDGRWVPYDAKTEFKIARIGNAAYSRLFGRLYKQHRALLDGKGPASEAKSDEVMAEVYGKTIVVGWRGPVELNGVDMSTYSQNNSEQLCSIKDFRRWAQGHAEDMESYKAIQEAEDAKN